MYGSAGVQNEIGDFLDYLVYERNVSVNTVTAYREDLESFVSFLCNDYYTLARDQVDLRRVDHLTIRAYLAALGRRKLARSSMARHLSALRSFFKYLMRESRVESNPARVVATPKRENHLPSVLQPSDVALLMEQPDLAVPRKRRFVPICPCGKVCSMTPTNRPSSSTTEGSGSRRGAWPASSTVMCAMPRSAPGSLHIRCGTPLPRIF